MKRLCVVVVLGALAWPVFAGFNVADLERMAAKDIVPEIRLSAGYALVNHYAATKGEDELLALARGGSSEALRLAASLALAQKWLGAGKTREELLTIVTEDPSLEVRQAAVPALMEHLVRDAANDLLDLANTGATEELRYAAAKTYFQKTRGTFNREKLEAICQDDTASAAYRRAAAELLAGHYLFPPLTALSQEALVDQALHHSNPYLRYAAAYALVNLLAEKSADHLYRMVAALFLKPGVSQEYRWAYARSLGIRWAAGL